MKRYRPFKKKGKSFSFNKTGRQKGYDSKWEAYRRRFLHYNKYCYSCTAQSEVVDHVQNHRGNQELFESLTNHIPLCTYCHNYITGKFDRHKEQDLDGKMEWIRKQREKYNNTTKVIVMKYYSKK